MNQRAFPPPNKPLPLPPNKPLPLPPLQPRTRMFYLIQMIDKHGDSFEIFYNNYNRLFDRCQYLKKYIKQLKSHIEKHKEKYRLEDYQNEEELKNAIQEFKVLHSRGLELEKNHIYLPLQFHHFELEDNTNYPNVGLHHNHHAQHIAKKHEETENHNTTTNTANYHHGNDFWTILLNPYLWFSTRTTTSKNFNAIDATGLYIAAS